jgi:hypothetical protein
MDFFLPLSSSFVSFWADPLWPPPPLTPFFTFAIRLVHLRKREKRGLTQLHLDIVCDSICLSISQTQSNQSVICQRLFFLLLLFLPADQKNLFIRISHRLGGRSVVPGES